MATNSITIPLVSSHEKRVETNNPLSVCSRLPAHRSDGAFLSIVELRRRAHVDIALTVEHIRQLVALEDGR